MSAMAHLKQKLAGKRVERGTWEVMANHRLAFEIIKDVIGADRDEKQWGSVTRETFTSVGLSGLLAHYYHKNCKVFLEKQATPAEWATI